MAGVLPIDWPVSCSDGFSLSKLVPHQFDSSGRAGGRAGSGRGGEKKQDAGRRLQGKAKDFHCLVGPAGWTWHLAASP